jgi:alkylated DNA repair dioxygenase AlkB
MSLQYHLFAGVGDQKESASTFPEGFLYQSELISPADEGLLLENVRMLSFRDFEFHGYTGKRRVVSFGWQYDFSGRHLRKANDIPEFLLGLRTVASAFAGLEPEALPHVLVTEYGPGAGIGWHRDKAVFGEVVGVSLLSPCMLRMRRSVGGKWERVNLKAEPRSAYLLSGPARMEWEHSIPPVRAARYSISFRTLFGQ